MPVTRLALSRAWRRGGLVLLVLLLAALCLPVMLASAAVGAAERLVARADGGSVADAELAAAISRLDQVARWVPPSTVLERTRARLALARGDNDGALAAIERAVALDPQSLAVRADATEIYLMAGDQARAADELARLGASPQAILSRGEWEFRAGRYARAYAWLSAAAWALPEPPVSLAYRRLTAAALSGQVPTDLEEMVFPVGEGLRVRGEQLRWSADNIHTDVSFGDELKVFAGREPGVGYLWWPRPASLIVQVDRPGAYRLAVRGCSSDASRTVGLKIGLGHTTIGQFALDVRCSRATLVVPLDAGLHVITLQASSGGGKALVDYLAISPRRPSEPERRTDDL